MNYWENAVEVKNSFFHSFYSGCVWLYIVNLLINTFIFVFHLQNETYQNTEKISLNQYQLWHSLVNCCPVTFSLKSTMIKHYPPVHS